jgi:hypothetical protein
MLIGWQGYHPFGFHSEVLKEKATSTHIRNPPESPSAIIAHHDLTLENKELGTRYDSSASYMLVVRLIFKCSSSSILSSESCVLFRDPISGTGETVFFFGMLADLCNIQHMSTAKSRGS